MTKKIEQSKPDPLHGLTTLERLRVASLDEAEHLSGLSKETIRRHHSALIINLSPRRQGIRIQDALTLRQKKTPCSPDGMPLRRTHTNQER